FSDNNGAGWDSPKYYPTIQYADVTGDGRADVCARNSASIWCAAWTDKGWSSGTNGPTWSDAQGWSSPQYFETIRLADINGDKKADFCARGPSGYTCTLSNGNTTPGGSMVGTSVSGPSVLSAFGSGWGNKE